VTYLRQRCTSQGACKKNFLKFGPVRARKMKRRKPG
jgi:hypothetical protein